MLVAFAGYALLLLVSLPGLIRHKMKREGIVFGVLLLAAGVIIFSELMGMGLKSPIQLIRSLLEDVLGLTYSRFAPG